MRLDRWLWAARFGRTRAAAQALVEAGRVTLRGAIAKPSREVRPGDRIEVTIGAQTWDIVVLGLSEKRGAAKLARTLYEETPESRARRERAIAERRYTVEPASAIRGRPTKRDRRVLDRWRRGE